MTTETVAVPTPDEISEDVSAGTDSVMNTALTSILATVTASLAETESDGEPAPIDDSPIKGFTRGFIYLANDSPYPIVVDQIYYKTLEHAFQAHKVLSQKKREIIALSPTAEHARSLVENIPTRDDWDDVKLDVLRQLLEVKFNSNQLRPALIETLPRPLINQNTDHDQLWGDCVCSEHIDEPGQNLLGQLLTELRDRLATSQDEAEPEYVDDGTFVDVEPEEA